MNARKYLISVGLAMGVALGAGGIAAATTGAPNPPVPVEQSQTPVAATAPQAESNVDSKANQADDKNEANDVGTNEETNGVDCQDGIIVATGVECDGGPSANSANDKNEANDVETNDAASVESGTIKG